MKTNLVFIFVMKVNSGLRIIGEVWIIPFIAEIAGNSGNVCHPTEWFWTLGVGYHAGREFGSS